MAKVLKAERRRASRLRTEVRQWLCMIAEGKLAAEVVEKFAGQNMLIRTLAELPLQRQQDIARGEELVVVTFGKYGFSSEKVQAHRLTAPDIALVFDKGHIRTPDEQIPELQKRARERQRRKPETVQLRLVASEYQAGGDCRQGEADAGSDPDHGHSAGTGAARRIDPPPNTLE